MKVSEIFKPQPPKLGTGARLVFAPDSEEFILAQVCYSEVAAISLRDGNRYRSGVMVDDIHSLTKAEAEAVLHDLNNWVICDE